MKKEYAFSRGQRGKFFRPDAELNVPIYLEPRVAVAAQEHARRRRTNVEKVVNEWLRKSIRSARQGRKAKTR